MLGRLIPLEKIMRGTDGYQKLATSEATSEREEDM